MSAHVIVLGGGVGGSTATELRKLLAGEAEVVARSVAAELGIGAPAGVYAGQGECWVEIGDGLAAHGHGEFFGDPVPVVSLEPPTGDAHRAKEAWERDSLARWD